MSNDDLLKHLGKKGGEGSGRHKSGVSISNGPSRPPKGVSKEDYAKQTKEANDRYQAMLNKPPDESKPGEVDSWNHGGELFNKVKNTNNASSTSHYPIGSPEQQNLWKNSQEASNNLDSWQKEHQAKFGRLQKPAEIANAEEKPLDTIFKNYDKGYYRNK